MKKFLISLSVVLVLVVTIAALAQSDLGNIVVRGTSTFLGRPMKIVKQNGTGDLIDVCPNVTCSSPYFKIDSSGVMTSTPSFATVLSTTTTLTAAQTKLLHTTPIAVVAAPGAGKLVQITGIVAKNVFGTVAYTGANALEFRYTDGSGVKVTGDIASAFIDVASGTRVDVAVGSAAAVAVMNAAVVVAVPVADPAAGDGIITLTTFYRVVTP